MKLPVKWLLTRSELVRIQYGGGSTEYGVLMMGWDTIGQSPGRPGVPAHKEDKARGKDRERNVYIYIHFYFRER